MSISLCICQRLPGSHRYQHCSRDPSKGPRVDYIRKRGLILAPCNHVSSLRRWDTPIEKKISFVKLFSNFVKLFQKVLFANNYIIVREQFAKSWDIVTLANSSASNSRTVHEQSSPDWAKKGFGEQFGELFANCS